MYVSLSLCNFTDVFHRGASHMYVFNCTSFYEPLGSCYFCKPFSIFCDYSFKIVTCLWLEETSPQMAGFIHSNSVNSAEVQWSKQVYQVLLGRKTESHLPHSNYLDNQQKKKKKKQKKNKHHKALLTSIFTKIIILLLVFSVFYVHKETRLILIFFRRNSLYVKYWSTQAGFLDMNRVI